MEQEHNFSLDETRPIVVDHIVIRDVDTKEEFVNQRSSMHIGNISDDD